MANFLDVTVSPVITDGGSAVIPSVAGWSLDDLEVDEYQQASYRIGIGEDKFFGIKGSSVGGETDPVVLPFSKITGYQLKSTVPVLLKIDLAVAGIQVTNAMVSGTSYDNIKVEASGQIADVRLLIWGTR